MVDVVLSPEAIEELPRIQATGGVDSTAIVITPDQTGDGLSARFINLNALRVLKTDYLMDVAPGVQVHAFGLDTLPEACTLELTFAPSRNTGEGNISPFELNMSYNFNVQLRQHVAAKAG